MALHLLSMRTEIRQEGKQPMNWTVRILAQRATAWRVRLVVLASLVMAVVASASVSLAAPLDQGSTSAASQSVSIASFAFAPAEVSVPLGATLTWTNAQDGVPHTATSLDGVWDSGVLSTTDSFGFTFSQAGDFAYQCTIHPTMRGLVHVVVADASTQGDSAISAPPPAATVAATTPQVTITPPPVIQATPPTPPVVVPSPQATATPASSYHY
jgi:plastocyanin